MSAKEILLEVAEKLPPNATLVDAIYELEFRQAVEEGLASLDRGERIPIGGRSKPKSPHGLENNRATSPVTSGHFFVDAIGNRKSEIGSPLESLPLSLLNDFLYCPRRAALKVVEGWMKLN
jgi:hypothetical protein